jgi:hypothetical protein
VHDLYPGFVKVANAIADRCPTVQLSVYWIDSHLKSHKFSKISINELQPDLTALVIPKSTKGYPVLSSSKKKMIPPWWRRVLGVLEVEDYGQNTTDELHPTHPRRTSRSQIRTRFYPCHPRSHRTYRRQIMGTAFCPN